MNQEERSRFGTYLRSLRKAQTLSQKDAAEKAQISSPYLAQLEKGQRNAPSWEILIRLAKLYGVSEETMLEAAGVRETGSKSFQYLDTDRLDWAFNTVLRDPEFVLATRMQGTQFTPEVKAFIVELYLKNTNRQLFTTEERAQLQEVIGLDTSKSIP